MRPQERMSGGIRRRRDGVADRLENLRFAQIGNDQAEQQALPLLRVPRT